MAESEEMENIQDPGEVFPAMTRPRSEIPGSSRKSIGLAARSITLSNVTLTLKYQ